jgi:hypothetical protein
VSGCSVEAHGFENMRASPERLKRLKILVEKA